MHATACRALRTACRRRQHPAYQMAVGVRQSPSRQFHDSPVANRIPEDQAGTAANGAKNESDGIDDVKEQPVVTDGVMNGVGDVLESNKPVSRSRRRRDVGSAIRRTKRNQQATQLPSIHIPDWFLQKNVKCAKELADVEDRLSLYGLKSNMSTESIIESSDIRSDGVRLLVEKSSTALLQADALIAQAKSTLESMGLLNLYSKVKKDPPSPGGGSKASDSKYHLHNEVFTEVLASIRADLVLPHPKLNKEVLRPDTLLLSSGSDRQEYLSAVVDKVAWALGADVIRLELEDLAQVLGDYLGENIAWTKSPTALIGYGSDSRPASSENYVEEEEVDTYSEDVDENDDRSPPSGMGDSFSETGRKPSQTTFAFLPSIFLEPQGLPKGKSLANLLAQAPNLGAQLAPPNDDLTDQKLSIAAERIIGAANAKRLIDTLETLGNVTGGSVPTQPVIGGLIIHINEYKRLREHAIGSKILDKIRQAVNRRWHAGSKIVLVGSASEDSADHGRDSERDWVKTLSSRAVQDGRRTIFITPPVDERVDDNFDASVRAREVNIRHVEHMIRKLINPEDELSVMIDLCKNLSLTWEQKASIERGVWSPNRVRHIATTMVGLGRFPGTYDGPAFKHALSTLGASIKVKMAWATSQDDATSKQAAEKSQHDIHNVKNSAQDRLNKLKKICSNHERKLLGGIIDSANINVTFADIQAPPETIEALKTLITLSIVRPESFSYGVLATDKIPGMLVYGPPGCGKTLLAKAIAKESGSTVLEVSASEINDMFVGEGEKNIKAVFSLAKKLSPCVVFIDEADALFGARGEAQRRRSHRELINQWLRELDGMENHSAFIMVATNRPFDIDEAILRRLPRRLLVDLPVEKDREAILKIHLKGETLDDSVSITDIAKDTPFYSGSDLKNLSVAAALACVREENEVAAKHTGSDAYVYPPKRTLRKEHFDKAIEEISASISEDMSTLGAIRKFDEKYGDRKGRRKRGLSLGFGGTTEPDKDSEAGRVRKMAVL